MYRPRECVAADRLAHTHAAARARAPRVRAQRDGVQPLLGEVLARRHVLERPRARGQSIVVEGAATLKVPIQVMIKCKGLCSFLLNRSSTCTDLSYLGLRGWAKKGILLPWRARSHLDHYHGTAFAPTVR